MAGDGRHVRISGPCIVSDEPVDRERLFEAIPWIERYMSGPDDPNFAVLRLMPEHVRMMKTDDLSYEEVRP